MERTRQDKNCIRWQQEESKIRTPDDVKSRNGERGVESWNVFKNEQSWVYKIQKSAVRLLTLRIVKSRIIIWVYKILSLTVLKG